MSRGRKIGVSLKKKRNDLHVLVRMNTTNVKIDCQLDISVSVSDAIVVEVKFAGDTAVAAAVPYIPFHPDNPSIRYTCT